MSEPLHPDGLGIEATPYADEWHDEHVKGQANPARSVFAEVAKLERRARKAETQLALEVSARKAIIQAYEENIRSNERRVAKVRVEAMDENLRVRGEVWELTGEVRRLKIELAKEKEKKAKQ
jgi:hypothetical protein